MIGANYLGSSYLGQGATIMGGFRRIVNTTVRYVQSHLIARFVQVG